MRFLNVSSLILCQLSNHSITHTLFGSITGRDLNIWKRINSAQIPRYFLKKTSKVCRIFVFFIPDLYCQFKTMYRGTFQPRCTAPLSKQKPNDVAGIIQTSSSTTPFFFLYINFCPKFFQITIGEVAS